MWGMIAHTYEPPATCPPIPFCHSDPVRFLRNDCTPVAGAGRDQLHYSRYHLEPGSHDRPDFRGGTK